MMNQLSINKTLKKEILEIAESGNGPFYIYDTQRIQQNCLEFLNIPYVPKSIHFAMMANSNLQFLKIVRQAGLKIFVNSLLHLETALELGFMGDEIIYAASAMEESAMRKVKSYGTNLILDSMRQIDLYQSLFPGTGIGIRCNIGELVVPKKTAGGYFIGNKSRLGLSIESVKSLKGSQFISGLHIYVGTNISEIDYFLNCYKHVANLGEIFPNLEYIDFGGGFGPGEKINRKFDVKTFGRKITELMKNVSDKSGHEIKLILEPGRIIGAESGYFVCKVTDIKISNDRQLIGVNASCVQFPRPLFYPDSAYHPVSIVRNNGCLTGNSTLPSSIYGCSTYSRDYLARETDLPQAHIGDLVILGHAGSYCATAYTSFLGFPKAEEYFL